MQFDVTELSGAFQGDQATVQEMEHIVRYAPPTFAVYAAVTASLEAGEAARVGLIQEVVARRQEDTFATGVGRWEIGALDERPISDSNGNFPWYDGGQSRVTTVGPQSSLSVQAFFTDTPTATITWVPPSGGGGPSLHTITREQRFTDWVASLDLVSSEVTPLKTLTWGFSLSLTFDCTRPIGSRLVGSHFDSLPVTVSDGGVIPGIVLLGPSANEADGYYWYPNDGGRTQIVAPTSPRL